RGCNPAGSFIAIRIASRPPPLTKGDGSDENMGRSNIWAGPLGRMLVLAWKEEKDRDAGKSDGDIIATLRTRPPWKKWSQETLLRKLFDARRHGDSPVPIAADATRRAYRSDFIHFTTWCGIHNLTPLPASIETAAAYLAHLADSGLSASTITRRSAALTYAHRLAGLPA